MIKAIFVILLRLLTSVRLQQCKVATDVAFKKRRVGSVISCCHKKWFITFWSLDGEKEQYHVMISARSGNLENDDGLAFNAFIQTHVEKWMITSLPADAHTQKLGSCCKLFVIPAGAPEKLFQEHWFLFNKKVKLKKGKINFHIETQKERGGRASPFFSILAAGSLRWSCTWAHTCCGL